jgi:hypothetical protein
MELIDCIKVNLKIFVISSSKNGINWPHKGKFKKGYILYTHILANAENPFHFK